MPIYEYHCDKCGDFEVTQRITEDPLKKCPTCRSKVRKLISSTSFMLKGTGWYATDYARKSSGSDAGEAKSDGGGGEAKGESKGEATGEPKGDAKSEAKAEAKSAGKGASKSPSKSSAADAA
jgi:putative FmdB family regulatory protein